MALTQKIRRSEMLNADRVPCFETCPRCGEGGIERLKTHVYCVNCNYSDSEHEQYEQIPSWVFQFLKQEKIKSKINKSDEDEQIVLSCSNF